MEKMKVNKKEIEDISGFNILDEQPGQPSQVPQREKTPFPKPKPLIVPEPEKPEKPIKEPSKNPGEPKVEPA